MGESVGERKKRRKREARMRECESEEHEKRGECETEEKEGRVHERDRKWGRERMREERRA